MKNLVFNLRTAKAQAEGCAKVTKSSRMAKILTTLTLLLTLCVGQMWAGAGFYEVYFTYSYNGTTSNATYTNSTSTTQTIDLGTLTADFKITSIYLKYWKDGSGNMCGGLVDYYISSDQEYQPSWTWTSKGGNNHELSSTANWTIAQYNTGASGSYTFWYRFKTWGSSSSSSGCSDNYYIPTNSNNKNKFTYNIAPPAVSGFGVSTSGFLAGSGTSSDPYLVKSGNSLTFTVSGSKARTDANSTFNYWLNSGTKKTSGTLSTGSITSTSLQSATIHGQCINNSSSSLVGTESTSTIYYKAVSVKDISVYIYVGGRTSAEINSVEMNGCTPYVGTKALSSVKINNQSAGAPKFTLSGNWLYYTFTNVTKVSNITCARDGGNIFTGEITDNVYYMYDGTELDSQCVPRANPTWGTAPASGAIGGSMTATVSGAPDGATITWTSTNTSAATVNSSGVISYEAAGNTTIKARVQKAAGGDNCKLDYTLSQDISVTSGATVTATRTCPAYVSTGAGEVTLDITSTGASSGWYYRIKNKSTGGYYAPDNQSAASNALSWTMTGGIGAELTTLVVELYNGSNTLICTSSDVTVTGEVAHITYIAAGSNGSVSPKTIYANNNHVHPSITATPNSHYHFKEWTSNNAAASVASTKNATTTVTATAGGYTITAYFEGDQYTITYKDKDNAAYSGSNEGSLPATHRYGTATALVNGVRSGYTFVGWYTNSSCTGDAVTSIGATSQTGNFTLYAKWTENTVTLTPTNHYDAGNPGYSAPTGGGTIGISTTRTIVAPAAGTGYTFAGWTLSSNLVVTGGNKNTDRTITVRTNGDGNAVSATANYNEVLTTNWYLTGSMNSWSTTANKFAKHTGESTGNVAYTTIDLAANTHYEFGVNNGSDYYANNNGSSEDYYIKGTIENWTFNKDLGYGVNCHIKTTLAGTYTFKIDFSAANPKISVYYPEIYAISGDFNSWTETSNLVFDGNVGTATINITGSATAYEFKVLENGVWCGATLNITGNVSNQQLTVGGGDNITLSADVYPNGDYTFTYNKSTHKLSVAYPTSYQISFERVPTAGGKTAPWANFTGNINDKQITSGVVKIADGATAYFYAATQSDHYTYYGWYSVNDAPKGTYTNRLVSTQRYSTTVTSSTPSNLYATYYDNDYNVSVVSSDATNAGTVAQSYMTAHKDKKETIPTATAKTGFYFYNWTKTGTATLYSNTSATAAQINGVTASDAVTVTANFLPKWSVASTATDPEWSTTANKFTTAYYQEDSKWKGNKTITLAANTEYELKMYDIQSTPHWYGTPHGSNEVHVHYAQSNNANDMSDTNGSAKNLHLHTAAVGEYTFKWNVTDQSLQIVFPTSWYITTGQKTVGQDDSNGGSFTAVETTNSNVDVKGGKFVANNATVTSTATPNTGYNFSGWYSESTCTTAYVNGTGGAAISGEGGVVLTLSSIRANKDIYAKFTPKTYTITLTRTGTGYSSGGDATLTATYGAAFPAATMPTAAEGYAFMGYYSEANGAGTQFTNASGVLLANITDYSDESGNWKYDGTKTLYAYYKKAEITDITLNASIFEPVEADADPKAYVTADPVIAPTPTPTTKLCWELRYSNDNPVAGEDYKAIPVSGDQVKFLLNGLAAGGYKIHVELRTGSTCGAGTLLSSYDKSFSIASDHIVTVQYKCGDFTLKSPTSVGGKPLDWSEVIEAASITGYTFNHWEAGEGVTIKDDEGEDKTTSTDATIQIKAIYDSKLTAVYTKKRVIYFYNTLGWSNVYVYFYSNAYWNNDNGTGSQTGGSYTGINGQMLPIEEGSPIYYFDAEAAGVNASYTYVSFTELQQNSVEFFGQTGTTKNKVIYRGDYKSTTLPMFVPLANQTPEDKNSSTAKYYNKGYWMNYPENTGYTLRIYSSSGASEPTRTIRFPFSNDKKMPLKLDVEFNEAATNYYYTIYREDGTVLSAKYGMNTNWHSDVRLNDPSKKISIKTTAPGIYTFTLVYKNTPNLDYYISVDYPIVANDYRILYSDNATWSQGSAHTAGWSHPSDVIRKNTDAEVTQYDTVSFYIAKGDGITASMKFQYASAIEEAGAVTWTNVAGGGITLSDFSEVITKAGVYNFIIKQEGTADPVVEKVEPYTGKFYIRTDCAGSTKWDYYRASDHEMPYTEFSMSDANSFGEKYSHYYTHWCPGGTNIKFVVANEYSSCISDTLESDLHDWGNLNDGGWLKHQDGKSETEDIYSANVRFMYNQETNKISRAYVASSTNAKRLFLVLRGNEVIKDENGTPVSDQGVTNGAILSDKENWIYERILQIKPDSRFKLFACYAQGTPTQAGAQYFRGAYDSDNFTTNDNSVILISGTGDHQKARILYDFKTNRLICAWLPSDATITEELNIDADVMVIRDHQEAAECITFSGDGELKKVKTVYGAMKFNRWTLNNRYRGKGGVEDNNKDHCDSPADIAEYHGILPAGEQKSVYERSMYFISFPFDVKVSEIFGFGTYGKHWILEYYDGLNRAKNGYWIDSPANWKYVTPSMAKTYELKAYEGYILCLSLGRMAYDNTEFWPNDISNVELYFPSKTPMANIQTTDVTIPGLSDEYRCTINREGEDGDRRIKDSYWRCLGVPSYDMYAGTLTSDGSTVINWQTDYSTFPFLYAWNMNDNTLTPQSTNRFSFKPMHAYLTQIGTAIYWKNVSATPAVMARQTEEPTEYNWCLTLNAGEQMIDQTYVRMSTDEVITNEFDFGQDLSKELNTGRSDIYSFIGNERAAANSMQMNTETTTIVPLGLNIEATGEYTFSIPDGTNGIGITLIDEETGIRTSLSALDYTVELAAGDYTERFWLEISPIQNTPTGIEDPTSDSSLKGRAQKRIIDGVLYIVKDGKIFDARGTRVE